MTTKKTAKVVTVEEALADETQPITMTQAQLVELMRLAAGNSDDAIRKQAEAQALANKEVFRPENLNPPLISALNPLGDRDHPRPAFKCKFYWASGYDLQQPQQTYEECLLLNAVIPGSYRVEKADGSKMPMAVEASYGLDGVTLQEMRFHFPAAGGEQQHDHLPMRLVLRSIILQQPDGRKTVAEIDRELAPVREAEAAQA